MTTMPKVIRWSGALLVAVAALAAHAAPAAAQQGALRGLDQDIERARQQWEVPGVAVSIVKDGEVIYAKGFGVRELGRPEKVDERTMFAIGSSSKAFTAAAVGILVDDGEVEWDDRAAEVVPGFQLYDPYVTREITLADLLAHNSGLVRGDLLWGAGEFDRREIMRRIRHLEPSWSFRSNFGYQNIMYLTAGIAVEEVTGKSWDAFVEERIFGPLAMRESNTTIRGLDGMANVATPHAPVGEDDAVVPVSWRLIDNIGPAGSINSNVFEMANWVKLHLGEGEFEGTRVLSEDVVREMQKPRTLIPVEGGFGASMAPGAHFMAYGLGWFLWDNAGVKVVQHGGNIDGMSALVAMVPELELGAVILTNMNGSGLPQVVWQEIMERYVEHMQPRDWSASMKASRDSMMTRFREREREIEASRIAGTSPSLDLGEYAGTYRSEMYGDLTIRQRGGALWASYAARFEGPLEHWHHDTFRVDWQDPMAGEGFVTFELDARGRVAAADVQGLTEFERVREERAAAQN